MIEDWVEWSEIVRNVAIVVGGAFGLWLAWKRTRSLDRQTQAQIGQEEIARRQHGSELFRHFAENLDGKDGRIASRVAAVHGLVGLASEFPDRFDAPVRDVLLAHKLNHSDLIDEEVEVIDSFVFKWLDEIITEMEGEDEPE